jgi:hypothetical protein
MSEQEKDRGFVVRDRRASASEDSAPPPEAAPGERALPEIDFSTFALSLASSALCHLGQMPNPDTRRAEVDLALAKQTIDILGMLQEKTRGNLSHNEAKLLENLLYDLRLKYVELAKRP